MKIILNKLIILLSINIQISISFPTISLKIIKEQTLINEIKLNFLFYIKYSKIISSQELSPIYKLSYISEDWKNIPFSKNKNEKHILLFDSYSKFLSNKASNMSNIIIFPEKFIPIINNDLLIHFDCKQFIFFINQKQFDDLIKADIINNERIYAKIFVPDEISKNFANKEKYSTITEYYFVIMLLTFILFFFYLFHYNFLIPLLYRDFWLFFISQFYLFIPLRFILLILLSIKLVIIQNIRGLLPSAPGFFVILAVQKSLIKTNIITTILLANEGLYIFENMKKIIRRMTIYKIQFFFISIILIFVFSFPFHLITIITNTVIFIFIIFHALINYKKLKHTLKIVYLTNKKYMHIIKLKISIWIKQNIIIILYYTFLIIVYFYTINTTNELLIEEIVCLKCDMLEYCVENFFLFAFCFLYKPKHLERNFFIVYTERFGTMNLKIYYTELNKKDNIRNKLIEISKKEILLNKKKILYYKKKNIKKPIIILNPRILLRSGENIKKSHGNDTFINNKFFISVGNIK